MQIEKYTDRLKTLIQSAQTLALRSGHQQFTPLHVLKALLEDEDRLAANLIDAATAAISDRYRNDWQEVGAAMRTRDGSMM